MTPGPIPVEVESGSFRGGGQSQKAVLRRSMKPTGSCPPPYPYAKSIMTESLTFRYPSLR